MKKSSIFAVCCSALILSAPVMASQASLDIAVSNTEQKVSSGSEREVVFSNSGPSIQFKNFKAFGGWLGLSTSLNPSLEHSYALNTSLMPNISFGKHLLAYGKFGATLTDAPSSKGTFVGSYGVGLSFRLNKSFGIYVEHNYLYEDRIYSISSNDFGLSVFW